MHKNVAGILTIGTEITTGQIPNRHAEWLSNELTNLGFEVSYHISVGDEERSIQDALEFLDKHCRFLIITGGLGPTRDDLTRQEVANWLNQPLTLLEEHWRQIESRLQARGIQISKHHPSQAMVPKGAEPIENEVGTALGFHVKQGNLRAWVLPGPTQELRSMWSQRVLPSLKKLAPLKNARLRTWRCLGKPESELADLVEKVLEGSQLKTGYRLASPYVEVKVWAATEIDPSESHWISKLESVIGPWLLCQDSQDLGVEFLKEYLPKGPVTVLDDVTEGALAERLYFLVRSKRENLGTHPPIRILSSSHQDLSGLGFEGPGITLKIHGAGEANSWKIHLEREGKSTEAKIEFAGGTRFRGERLAKARCELTLKKAIELTRERVD